MRNNPRILAICRQPLRSVQNAVRAHNLYKYLENLGCKVKYLDGWKPSYNINPKNLENWLEIFLLKWSKKKLSYVFIENVQSYLLAKIFKKIGLPIVLDVRDDLNLHAESMGIEIPLDCYLERELAQVEWFELSQRILVTSQGYLDYYSKKYNGKYDRKYINIMNASDPNRFRVEPLPLEPRIGILGGANLAEGFDILIESCRLIKSEFPKATVHIGYKFLPETKSYIRCLKENYKDNWVYFYENIDYTTNAPNFYSSLFLSVIPRLKTTINEISTPSKLFDCMACARPLVVTNCKEQARIVTEENCGLVCDFTPEDMAEKITKLLGNPSLARELGQNGRRAVVERHNWSQRTQTIVKEIFEKVDKS